MPEIAISFKSRDAAAEFLEGLAKEVRERGDSERMIEDNQEGDDLRLRIVDEGSEEFDTPVFELTP